MGRGICSWTGFVAWMVLGNVLVGVVGRTRLYKHLATLTVWESNAVCCPETDLDDALPCWNQRWQAGRSNQSRLCTMKMCARTKKSDLGVNECMLVADTVCNKLCFRGSPTPIIAFQRHLLPRNNNTEKRRSLLRLPSSKLLQHHGES